MNNDPNFAATVMTALAAKAPLASPALTGTPTAPTAAAGTNTTQIATTAFVRAAIAALAGSAPAVLDTLAELATAMNNDPNFATTVLNALAAKAPLASPALTGTPTAPTAAAGTSSTQIATTGFVNRPRSPADPQAFALGTGGDRFVTGLVGWRPGTAPTGALVFLSPPFTDTQIMHSLRVRGYNFSTAGNTIDFQVSGNKSSAASAWDRIGLTMFGNRLLTVRWARKATLAADGSVVSFRNALIVGDIASTWAFPYVVIEAALFSGAALENYAAGWTAEVVTDLSAPVPGSGVAGFDQIATPTDLGMASKLDASKVSTFGLSLIDDADAVTARATLGATGNLFKSTVILASQDFTLDPETKLFVAEYCGGGGAGGGAQPDAANGVAVGGGGGAGGWAESLFVRASDKVTIVIGAPGLGGVGNNSGGAGGRTSVTHGGTTVVADGGLGGGTHQGGQTAAARAGGGAGAGSSGTTGARLKRGMAGSLGWMLGNGYGNANQAMGCSGAGADGMLGAGGGEVPLYAGSAVGLAGQDSQGYGAGGSGAVSINSTTSYTGGKGTAGVVIIREYR